MNGSDARKSDISFMAEKNSSGEECVVRLSNIIIVLSLPVCGFESFFRSADSISFLRLIRGFIIGRKNSFGGSR